MPIIDVPSSREKTVREPKPPRIRVTARISAAAYDAIADLQRDHRHRTGKALRLWQVVDGAIVSYAHQKGIGSGE